jgi:nucleoid DNA-binding protein
MTKAELIEKIAKDADIPKSTAKVAFNSALDGIKAGLKKKQRNVTAKLGRAPTFIRNEKNPASGKVSRYVAFDSPFTCGVDRRACPIWWVRGHISEYQQSLKRQGF